MKPEVQNCLTWFANKVSETTIYPWSAEFKESELKKASEQLYEELKKHIDVTKLTVEEAKELRFREWDDGIYLFPLWLVPIIPDGLEVTSISGVAYEYHASETDNDIRFGCVAYGIKIKDGEQNSGKES